VNKDESLQRLDQSSLDRFKELFRGRTDWYGHRDFRSNKCWTEGARGEDGKLLKDADGNNLPPIPLEDEHFHRHFNKVQGLGIIPIQKNGNVNFGVLDIDKDDIDHVELVRRIKELGLPLDVFVSRSYAAHAFYFIGGEGKPADVVQKRLTQWGLALGCGGDLPTAEVFPKQKDLKEGSSVGNYINLPFFNQFAENIDPNDKAGKYVTKDGRFVGIEEFLVVAEQADPKMAMPLPIRTVAFEQGPPCLETLQQKGIPEGMRNLGLYNVGVYFKKSDPENWEDLLQAYNNKFMVPPFHSEKMPKKEMTQLIKSIRKKDYQYKCSEDPIASVCEKALCKTRLYGIKTKEEILRDKCARIEIPIVKLKKYLSEPVTWGLVLDTGKIVNVDGASIMNWQMLRRHLLDALTELPINMKQDEWDVKLTGLLKDVEEEELSEDAGESKMLLLLLHDFILNGSKNKRMVESGCAYLEYDEKEKGSWAYFTGKSLRSYMDGYKIKVLQKDMAVLLKQTGWMNKQKRFETENKFVWYKFIPGLKPQHNDNNNTGDTVDEALSRTTIPGVSG
jgi:hypothetical protein